MPKLPEQTKTGRIQDIVRQWEGRTTDAHYLGYFDCFNRQLYYEAHEVLEQIWLPQRKQPDGNFYKGLIQLAGAFVHLQKARLKPALSLLDLAQKNLKPYPEQYHLLDLREVLNLIERWRLLIQDSSTPDFFRSGWNPPALSLRFP